jgi:hypothetical protein
MVMKLEPAVCSGISLSCVERCPFSLASSYNSDSFPARKGGVKGGPAGEELLRMAFGLFRLYYVDRL